MDDRDYYSTIQRKATINTSTMFGWVDFKKDGKDWTENEKGYCLVRREEEGNF